jgi:hypothetical protein
LVVMVSLVTGNAYVPSSSSIRSARCTVSIRARVDVRKAHGSRMSRVGRLEAAGGHPHPPPKQRRGPASVSAGYRGDLERAAVAGGRRLARRVSVQHQKLGVQPQRKWQLLLGFIPQLLRCGQVRVAAAVAQLGCSRYPPEDAITRTWKPASFTGPRERRKRAFTAHHHRGTASAALGDFRQRGTLSLDCLGRLRPRNTSVTITERAKAPSAARGTTSAWSDARSCACWPQL